MPPIKNYIFICISDAQTEIIINTYDENLAKKRLEYHVKDITNWKLK